MNERLLQGSDYPDDTGEASPRLAAALAAYAVDETRYPDVLAALGGARLLVPVVAVLGEVETGADGLAQDKSSDMATVLLQGADGGRRCWRSRAPTRWPRGTRRVARSRFRPARRRCSAVQEGADALLVDVAGPVTVAVEGEDLRALAAGWRLARAGDRVGWVAPAD